MKGRLEHALKDHAKVKRVLSDFPDYVSEYYYNLSAHGEPKTCYQYVCRVGHFLKYINDDIHTINIEEITQAEISRYMLFLETKRVKKNGIEELAPTSNSYRQGNYYALKSFFEFMASNGYISSNPIEKVKLRYKTDEVRRIKLTKDDIRKIVGAVDDSIGLWVHRDKVILVLLATTGMRETALTEINVDEVDLENRMLHITDKGDKQHTYYLSSYQVNVINDWLADRKSILYMYESESDAFLITKNFKRMTAHGISDIVQKYSKKAIGKRLTPHKLRAAFCTILYDETGDINLVREAVGHAGVATTQRYIVMDQSSKLVARDIMEGIVDN